MILTRSENPIDVPPCELHLLTMKQRRVLEAIDAYWRATGDACPGSVLARRFNLHHSVIQGYLRVLYDRGWLRAPTAPAYLVRFLE